MSQPTYERDEWWRGAKPLTPAQAQHAREHSPFVRPVVAERQRANGDVVQVRRSAALDGAAYAVYLVLCGHTVPEFVTRVASVREAFELTA